MLHETAPQAAPDHPAAHLTSRPPVGRLAGLILLGGSVRASTFYESVARSPLELPLASNRSLLSQWTDQLAGLSARRGYPIPLRILADGASIKSLASATASDPSVKVEADPAEWRGTGGVLRDISGSYAPDDFLLVANSAQVLLDPLESIVASLESLRADAALLAHRDGSPATFMLLRCACLEKLPSVGFVDMKEQGLPNLANSHLVKVFHADHPITLGVRTASAYVRALRKAAAGPALEDWQSAFTLAEPGAQVDPSARTCDSVILHGARVEAAAVLVRSVVCAGAIVAPRERVIDKIVLADGRRISTEESK